MEFHEFGDGTKPAIVLLHAFGMHWKMWMPEIESFRREYDVILPALEGHEDENRTVFSSVQNNADQIISYLEKQNRREIFAICGASLAGRSPSLSSLKTGCG